jgi:hypothetical protein
MTAPAFDVLDQVGGQLRRLSWESSSVVGEMIFSLKVQTSCDSQAVQGSAPHCT